MESRRFKLTRTFFIEFIAGSVRPKRFKMTLAFILATQIGVQIVGQGINECLLNVRMHFCEFDDRVIHGLFNGIQHDISWALC